MKRNSLLLFFLLSINLLQAQTWIKKQLSQKVSVEFPVEPAFTQMGERAFYSVSDSNYVIEVVATDMSATPEFTIDSLHLNSFYKSVIMSRLVRVTDPRVVDEKDMVMGHYKAVELIYTKDLRGHNDVMVKCQIVSIENTFFIIEFCQLIKSKGEKIQKRFFESLEIK